MPSGDRRSLGEMKARCALTFVRMQFPFYLYIHVSISMYIYFYTYLQCLFVEIYIYNFHSRDISQTRQILLYNSPA